MKLRELINEYENIAQWKNNTCKILTEHYCRKHSQSAFEETKGVLRLTSLAKAHYNEVRRLSHSDLFHCLLEMEQDIMLCKSIERQINSIINGDKQ